MSIDEIVLKLYDDVKELSKQEEDLHWVRFVSANIGLEKDVFIERFNLAKVDREIIVDNKIKKLDYLSSELKTLNPNDLAILLQGSQITSQVSEIGGVDNGNNNSNI